MCYLSRIWIHLKPKSYFINVVLIITHTIVCVIHHVDQWTIWAMFSNDNHSYPILCLLKLVYLCWSIQLANELIEYFNASWTFAQCLSAIDAIQEKMLSHLLHSIVVALFDSCVDYFTWATLKCYSGFNKASRLH
jgi:hypothetical protein